MGIITLIQGRESTSDLVAELGMVRLRGGKGLMHFELANYQHPNRLLVPKRPITIPRQCGNAQRKNGIEDPGTPTYRVTIISINLVFSPSLDQGIKLSQLVYRRERTCGGEFSEIKSPLHRASPPFQIIVD